jgi:tRNA-specific 2-thiouridylase
VVAVLLRDAGHEIIGLSMQLYDQRGGEITFGSCCTLDDLHDARRVASRLGIAHYIVNLERRFAEQVVADFVGEYIRGRTPLPCVHCNSDLKFAALVERAEGFGADAVATGHYARVVRGEPGYALRRGLYAPKDQSYFLFSLTQAQLARALFPLGGLSKPDVREMARARRLPVADKRDSNEICFVPNDDYAAFVARRAPGAARPGPIVDATGRVVGKHTGVLHFTIGQRKGLGLAAGVPLYVTAIDAGTNTVVAGPRERLERRGLTASRVNWIAGEAPLVPVRAHVQIRSRHQAAAAIVTPLDGGRAGVEFDEPQSAITPGQAAVFYSGDEVLGGGWID